MGERKGVNKYYPPDYDPKIGGLNKFLGTHALRERARKLHLGIIIIRFEMPYNIWCAGCENHIGMGVRYNAEKTKVGMYYSTPLYQFRFKCHLCDNYIEMKTDPANLDYVIVSGARRQERRWDPTENGQVVPDDKIVSRQLADNAMFKLQHGVEDKTKLKNVTPTIGKLEDLQYRMRDDYEANKLMRDKFRVKKKELKAIEDKDNSILKRNCLDIALVAESEEDKRVASLLRLQPSQSSEERQKELREVIEKKSHFPLDGSTLEEIRAKTEKQRSKLGISFSSQQSSPSSRNLSPISSTTSTSSTSNLSSDLSLPSNDLLPGPMTIDSEPEPLEQTSNNNATSTSGEPSPNTNTNTNTKLTKNNTEQLRINILDSGSEQLDFGALKMSTVRNASPTFKVLLDPEKNEKLSRPLTSETTINGKNSLSLLSSEYRLTDDSDSDGQADTSSSHDDDDMSS